METSKSNKITMAVIIACIIALVVGYEVFVKSNKNECLVNITNKEELQEKKDNIEVYILGCVNKPGVYEVPKGITVGKVASKAGGFTKDADIERINLVHKLKDNVMLEIKSKSDRIAAEKEMERIAKLKQESNKLYVPKNISDAKKSVVVKKGDNTSGLSMKITKGMYDGENQEDEKYESEQININTASKEELLKLPGIGAQMAEKIIRYREQNGEFESIDDLKNVSGIGENKFNNVKHMLAI